MKRLHQLIWYLTGLKVVLGFPSGAPPQSCFHMSPGHFRSVTPRIPIPRRDLRETPFKVWAVIDGTKVRVTVNGTVPLQGFIIQARLSPDGLAIGQFSLFSQANNSVAKYQDCSNKKVFL